MRSHITKSILALHAFMVGMNGAYAAISLNFDLSTVTQLDGTYSQLAEDSNINRDNQLLLETWRTKLSIRPDLEASGSAWFLSLKPRFNAIWKKFDNPILADDTVHELNAEIKELFLRLTLSSDTHFVAGRERLMWGPSYLLSPSNPFTTDNGREDPSRDLIGQEFARFLWIANNNFSVSAITKFALKDDELNTYALKLDYTAEGISTSILPWLNDDNGLKGVGAYLSLHANEATIVYAEAMGIYAAEKTGLDNYILRELFGIAYTFLDGTNLAIELYKQSDGCKQDSLVLCAQLADTGRVRNVTGYQRQHYALLQWITGSSIDFIDLTTRFTYGLDDNSHRLTLLTNWDLGDISEIYFIANLNSGSSATGEFNQLFDYNLRLGLRLYL